MVVAQWNCKINLVMCNLISRRRGSRIFACIHHQPQKSVNHWPVVVHFCVIFFLTSSSLEKRRVKMSKTKNVIWLDNSAPPGPSKHSLMFFQLFVIGTSRCEIIGKILSSLSQEAQRPCNLELYVPSLWYPNSSQRVLIGLPDHSGVLHHSDDSQLPLSSSTYFERRLV